MVSIIVPVHNTADYLHKCIESLRSQTLQQIEIILVDNLSVDGSSEICDEYAKIDKRIKVLPLSIAEQLTFSIIISCNTFFGSRITISPEFR